MPTEENPATPDPRDAEIAALNQKLEAAGVLLKGLQEGADAAEALTKNAESRVALLERKLKDAKSAPTGDFVHLEGQTYAILTTVRADSTFVEVKRGAVNEGATLVVIDKVH